VRWKPLALVLTLVLVVGCVAGGSLAWLTDRAGPISNTFTIGNIDLELKHGQSTNQTITTASLVPGQTISANAMVYVEANSEPCYVFVHIAEANNAIIGLDGKVVDYTVASGLTAVSGHDGYYYKVMSTNNNTVSFYVFDGNLVNQPKFTVNPALTKEMVDADDFRAPTISVTAAAVQKENIPDKNNDGNIDCLDAWELLPAEFTGSTATP